MSIIAVQIKDNVIYLGADSIIARGNTQQRELDAKIRKLSNDFAFASAGTCKELELFYLFCLNRVPATNTELGIIEFMHEFALWQQQKTIQYSIENGYLIVYKEKAYSFENYFCREIDSYAVNGAGMDFALAAFHLGRDIEDALSTACDLSTWCDRPLTIYEFTKVQDEKL